MARKLLHAGRRANLTLVDAVDDPVELLGAPIDRMGHDDAVAAIERFINEGTPRQVATVNLDFLRIARTEPAFAETLREADLSLADGMPLVWASKLAGAPLPQRVAGVDLVEAICARGSALGWSVYLLGAAPGVAEAASRTMVQRYPGLRIAGVYSPPVGRWDDLEEKRIRDGIASAKPDVLLVALGAPRQDIWISENKARLGVPVSIGVGCTFDVMCGDKPRAPRWMQRTGFEWAFRLGSEPARLWRRYLSDLPTFARLMLSALRVRATGRMDTGETVRGGAR